MIAVLYLFTFFNQLIYGNRDFFGSADEFVTEDKSVEQKSREEYELLLKDSKKYGFCWLNAIEKLKVSCNEINEEKQSELAFMFTNCLLTKIGLPTYNCHENKETEAECMKNMSERAFNVYTHYFTHTQSICFFLANQLWQMKTKIFINKLSDSLINIGSDVNTLNSLNNQLKDQITDSKSVIEQFVDKINLQSQSFLDIRDLIINELTKGYTIVYYVISLISVYFLTSTKKTSNARLPLFTVILMNVVIERFIATYFYDDYLTDSILRKNKIDSLIWLSRKFSAAFGLVILLICYLRYKDFAEINYQMLNEIREQNRKILNYFESASVLSQYLSGRYLDDYHEETDSDYSTGDLEDSDTEIYALSDLALIEETQKTKRYNTRSSRT